ncbi:hypothetical protein, partial [Metallosphaera sp.]|uniref:hypothetical protein n=1 Tax=Metallosphaera sp. TaxID=2020860 RepID=UPI003172AD5E
MKIREKLSGIDFRQLEKAYQEATKVENGWKMIYRCLYKECPVTVEETAQGKRVEFSPFETWNPTVVGFQQDATLQEMLEKLRKAIENDFTKYVAITAEKISAIASLLKDTIEIFKGVRDRIDELE